MQWCEVAAVIHRHIVSSTIFCAAVISVETAYLMANPLSYDRSGTTARVMICLSTLLAITINLPINVCKFFWIQPQQMLSTMKEVWGWDDADVTFMWEHVYKDNRFYFIKQHQICERLFIPGSFDYRIIMYFIFAGNLIAVILIMVSYAVIFVTIRKSRNTFHANIQESGDIQTRRHKNIKFARAVVMIVGITLFPWLPNLIIAIFIEAGWQEKIQQTLGEKGFYGLIDATTYLLYVVPWIFSLINLLTNPTISKTMKGFSPTRRLVHVCRTGVVQTKPSDTGSRNEAAQHGIEAANNVIDTAVVNKVIDSSCRLDQDKNVIELTEIVASIDKPMFEPDE